MELNSFKERRKILNSLIFFLLLSTIIINISIIFDSLKINELKEQQKEVAKSRVQNESNNSGVQENNFSIASIAESGEKSTEQRAIPYPENKIEVKSVADSSYLPLSKQTSENKLTNDELAKLKLSFLIKNFISLLLMILIFFAFKFVSQDESEYLYKTNLMRLLNSDTRIKTIEALRKAPRTITDLSKITGKSKATVFEHLVLLMKEGIVEKEEIPGKKLVFYKLKNKHLSIWNDISKFRDMEI